MEITEDGYISVEPILDDFRKVLDNHDRCIFSARFGDGKTYFLNKFAEHYKDDYIIIPIYPVNYQVVDNKDIFEYIKRDILVKMLGSDQFNVADLNFDTFTSIRFFISENKGNILKDLCSVLPNVSVGIPGVARLIFDPKKMKEGLETLNNRYEEYKTNNESDRTAIDNFINSFSEQQGGIYEFDFYSELIRNLNIAARRTTGKKIALLIEDLDRIDPEHIFRILNIFSAHFDGFVSDGAVGTDDICKKNKFAFDNIITVCDYDNIENIYHHKYGEKTDFNGYIHKFSTAHPFPYSLRKYLENHLIDLLIMYDYRFPTLTDHLAKLIVDRHINDKDNKISLRKIKDSIRCPPTMNAVVSELYDTNNTLLHISTNKEFERLLTLLSRLKISPQVFRGDLSKDAELELTMMIGLCGLKHDSLNLISNLKITDYDNKLNLTYDGDRNQLNSVLVIKKDVTMIEMSELVTKNTIDLHSLNKIYSRYFTNILDYYSEFVIA